MRHEAEIRHGVFVAKSGDAGCEHHHTRYHAPCIFAELAVFQHAVVSVAHHPHVYVQTRASLSRRDFWSKGYLKSHLVG